jgi:hypothetical protein
VADVLLDERCKLTGSLRKTGSGLRILASHLRANIGLEGV